MLMENKLGNSDGDENPKNKRTLDLKSIYGSESLEGANESNEVVERKNGVSRDNNVGGEGRKRKRRNIVSNKTVGVNCVEISSRKNDKSSVATDHIVEAQLVLNQKSDSRNSGTATKSDSISLSLEDNVAKIPKRKRDILRRKQVECDVYLKATGGKLDADSSRDVEQTAGLAGDQCNGLDEQTAFDLNERSLNTTSEKKTDHFKPNSTRRSKKINLVHNAKLGIADSDDRRSDPTLKNKHNKRNRKRKNEPCLSLDTGKESSAIDNSAGNGLLDDEEESLEQNAARMLSSRFNPDLTGFSGDSKDSSNDLSQEQSARAGLIIQGQTAMDESDSALDDNGIVLRPRKELTVKSLSRKRRHFYEVMSEDLDPCWVLKKRIKVFWPLDKSWYIGLVKDYDPKKQQHHVKYEDREEEWIDLKNERFKLLLFPSEIPCKAEKTRSRLRHSRSERKQVVVGTIKSSGVGTFKDSEPIISWLSRTNKKIKTTSSGHIKNSNSGFKPQKATQSGAESARYSMKDDNSMSTEAAIPVDQRSVIGVEGFANDESVSFRIVNFPAVYSRRRFSREKFGNSIDQHTFGFGSDRVAYFDHLIENSLKRGEVDAFMGQHDSVNPLCFADINELLSPLAITCSSDTKLDINLLGFPILEHLPLVHNCQWLHSLFLLHYGAVTCLLPKVPLEILFVDNSAGLKLFLFENYMIQDVAIIFRILSIFRHYPHSCKYIDLTMPVTSVRIRFSSPYHPKKQVSYSVFCFSRLRNTDRSYLDSHLKRRCLFMKQLDLPECTYGNIDALQYEVNQMSNMTYSKKCLSIENENKCKEHSMFDDKSFLDRHLERLIGPRVVHISSIASASFPSSECTEASARCIVNCNSEPCNGSFEIDSHNGSKTLADPAVSVCNDSGQKVMMDSIDVNRETMSKEHFRKGSGNGGQFATLSSLTSRNVLQINGQPCHQKDFYQPGSKLQSLKPPALMGKPNSRKQPCVNRLGAIISSSGHTSGHSDGKADVVDLAGQLKQGLVSKTYPKAPRSMGRRTKNVSPSFRQLTRAWHDGKTESDRNDFKSGFKKLPMQASNSLADMDTDCNSKQRNLQLQDNSHKKMKKLPESKTVDSPRSPPKNLDLLSCAGNILIILEDRGWRECGAQVYLQSADHNEWVLSVKVAGIAKYTYKANQMLQSGATNRFTHAMMWKGGKDWTFEFPDRSQWILFKEMHNECYNRNLRAASVKIIPIPGVRLVNDFDDNVSEAVPFCSHPHYYLQNETDVELALNPSRFLYDMDSEDELWLSKNQRASEDNRSEEPMLSEEFFEKVMDMLEKAAYVRKRDEFIHQEIEEIFAGVGPTNLIMKIHDYWSQKRQRTGLPLLRQFQPPLWERYQKKLQEWEKAMSQLNNPLRIGGNKATLPEKPPMFAFCLKPRGTEVHSRGTKQRTHKKYHGLGHSSTAMGDHDGYHSYGRRYKRYYYLDEKITSPGSYDSSEFSPRLFSPRDGSVPYFSMDNGFDRNHQQKPYRIKSKKIGSLKVPFQSKGYSHLDTAMNTEPMQRKAGYPLWSRQKTLYSPQPQSHLGFLPEHLDGPDLEEFKLRDASGAAQHARIMAKLKRQKAERLHYRADLAMQKAMVALNIAKAVKESQGEPDP